MFPRRLAPLIPSLALTSTPFAITQTGGGSVNLTITTATGTPVRISWGDGTTTTVASGVQASRTYAGTYNGDVAVLSASPIKEWDSTSGRWSYNLSILPAGLTFLRCTGNNTVAGNLSSLPTGLTSFRCSGANTVTGNLSDLPAGLTYFNCAGANTVTGNLSSLPVGLTLFYLTGANTVAGNLSDLPAGLTYFNCSGANTVAGNLSDLPAGLTYFFCTGANTVTGNLSDLPVGLTNFYLTGSNTTADYSEKSWASNQQRIFFIPIAPGGLAAAEVDQLLINLAAAGGVWNNEKQVYLKGTNAARTSASNAAVATLQSKGVTVTTN